MDVEQCSLSQRHLHDLIPFNIIICITVSVMSELTNM